MSGMELVDLVRYGAGYLALAAGLFFVLVGAIGVLRFPDLYTRLHAAGVTDTLGAELMLLGLILQADSLLSAAKLALIGLFLFITSPTSTHALANAAFTAGLEPLLGRVGGRREADGGGADDDAA